MFHSSVHALEISVSYLDSTCPGDVQIPSPAPCAILFPAEGNLGHLESRRENANTPASVGKIFLLTSPKLKRPCQGTVSFPRLCRLAERGEEIMKRGAILGGLFSPEAAPLLFPTSSIVAAESSDFVSVFNVAPFFETGTIESRPIIGSESLKVLTPRGVTRAARADIRS